MTPLSHVTIFNLATRIIRKVYRVSSYDRAASQCQPGEMWLPGKGDVQSQYIDRNWEFRTRGDGGPDDPGVYVPPPVEAPVIPPELVKAEAARRLVDLDWRVERAVDQQDAAAEASLRAQRQHIRERSNAIEAMRPIPSDFTEDHHWTGDGNGR